MIRTAGALIVCALSCALAGAALGGPRGSAAIEANGIDGRWAVTCHKPADAENPYLVFEPVTGGPPRQRVVAPPAEDSVVELLEAEKLKSGEMSWIVPQGEVMLTVLSRLEGNRMRVWSVVTSDGLALVTKGVRDDGTTTPWLNKCETN